MVITANLDYATTFFEYPILDRIHGEPTYEGLKRMKKQLKANAQSVPSILGGGQFGLLGLVLTPAEYQVISNVAFVEPARPAALQIPPFTAQHDAIRLRGEHEEDMDTYRDCIAVKKALIKQIVAAVDTEYLKELRDPTTNSITLHVYEVLEHLFTTYGQVSAEVLAMEEASMNAFYWDLNDPPTVMFNKIEELQNLSTAAGMPKTEAQIINYGLAIIKRTNDFERALIEWYNLPDAQKTYNHFKTHFSAAQRELKKVRGPKMKDTKFHQANQVMELKADFTKLRDELVDSVNALTQAKETQQHQAPPQANATSDVNGALLALLKQMQEQMANMAGNGGSRGGNANGGPRYRTRRNTSKYCWSHGACAHDGTECTNPKEGHKKEATFENKMGGSTYYCKPARD